VVTVDRLAPDEPLSPELVLVLPPELRAEALARLPEPLWPKAQPRIAAAPVRRKAQPHVAAAPPRMPQSLTRILATVLVARAAQLMLIFVSVTALVLTLAAVANAVR
jgi:hypothetical protein